MVIENEQSTLSITKPCATALGTDFMTRTIGIITERFMKEL